MSAHLAANAAVGAPPAAAPIAPKERIEILDVLRGFALFGILLVNMAAFNTPWIYLMNSEVVWWTAPIDRAAELLIHFVAQGKFYSLFSFLFGLGFSIQMLRADDRGGSLAPLYRRRLFALLLFGLTHAFLLWYGDILATYAILGFFLFFFRKRQAKTVLIWAVVLLLLPMVVMPALFFAIGSDEAFLTNMSDSMRLSVDLSVRAYGQGGLAEMMAQRAADASMILSGIPFAGFSIFGTFLLGLYAGKRDLFRKIPEHIPFIRRINLWGLVLGLIGNAMVVVGFAFAKPMTVSLPAIVQFVGYTFGVPALFLFYTTSLILLFQRPEWRTRLLILAPAGRMALSNYLLQTIICTTLFYNYGFGLYGKVGPALGIVFTLVIWGAQIPLSAWWLRRFRFGPAEWLWRSMTYGKLQPMRA